MPGYSVFKELEFYNSEKTESPLVPLDEIVLSLYNGHFFDDWGGIRKNIF